MEFTNYVRRRPFQVEAVEITEENIEEVAKLIGQIRERDGKKFIVVNRRIIPHIPRAHVGWFLTQVGDNYRCYSPKLFRALFIEHSNVIAFLFNSSDVPANLREARLRAGFNQVVENGTTFSVVETNGVVNESVATNAIIRGVIPVVMAGD